MATTEERLVSFVERPVDERLIEEAFEAPVPTASRMSAAEWLWARVPAWFCNVMIVAWTVIFGAILALEPAPADPNAANPLYADLIMVAYLGFLITAYVGFVRRRGFGLAASAVASGLGVVLGIGCAVSGHHTGLYPVLETAGFVLLGGLGAAGLLRLRAGRASAI